MKLSVGFAFLMLLSSAGLGNAAGPAPEYSAKEFKDAILSGPAPCDRDKTPKFCESNPKTRSWSFGGAAIVASLEAKPHRDAKPHAKSSRRAHVTRSTDESPKAPHKLAWNDIKVNFETAKADITEQGQANLAIAAEALLTGVLKPLSFEVSGYTDAAGDKERNQVLSLRRANAVRDFLLARGVAPERLTTKGYGSDHLADPNDPVSEANRRVELHRLN